MHVKFSPKQASILLKISGITLLERVVIKCDNKFAVKTSWESKLCRRRDHKSAATEDAGDTFEVGVATREVDVAVAEQIKEFKRHVRKIVVAEATEIS